MQGLLLAMGLLTRLPLPAAREPIDLSRSAAWFPVAGAIVGGLVAVAAHVGGSLDPWLGALLGVLVWIGVTGGLHLDGLADLADALGAAHRDPERLLQVLKDPHIGSFGVLSLIAAVAAKLVLLMLWLRYGESLWALPLVAAWARLGAVFWAQSLKPLAPGQGADFARRARPGPLLAGAVALALLSLPIAPWLLPAAIIVLLLWRGYLKSRLGGMSGDCLGAGIEVAECLLLGLLLL